MSWENVHFRLTFVLSETHSIRSAHIRLLSTRKLKLALPSAASTVSITATPLYAPERLAAVQGARQLVALFWGEPPHAVPRGHQPATLVSEAPLRAVVHPSPCECVNVTSFKARTHRYES